LGNFEDRDFILVVCEKN